MPELTVRPFKAFFNAKNTLAILALGVSMLLVCIQLYWSLYSYKNVFKFNKPIKVLSEHIISGSWLVYEINYCKGDAYSDMYADVQISFVDHIVNNTPMTRSGMAIGCRVENQFEAVPPVPPGKYYLEMTRQYQVNPIKKVTVFSRSQEFEIFAK